MAWLGLKEAIVPFRRPPRVAGTTKYPSVEDGAVRLDGISSFSALPLKLMPGRRAVLRPFGWSYTLAMSSMKRSCCRRPSAAGARSSACRLIFSGAILTAIGLVGDYVARIYEETKGRPLYVIVRGGQRQPRRTSAGRRCRLPRPGFSPRRGRREMTANDGLVGPGQPVHHLQHNGVATVTKVLRAQRYHALDSGSGAAAMLLGVFYHAIQFGGMAAGSFAPRSGRLLDAVRNGCTASACRCFSSSPGSSPDDAGEVLGSGAYLIRRWKRIGLPFVLAMFTVVPLFLSMCSDGVRTSARRRLWINRCVPGPGIGGQADLPETWPSFPPPSDFVPPPLQQFDLDHDGKLSDLNGKSPRRAARPWSWWSWWLRSRAQGPGGPPPFGPPGGGPGGAIRAGIIHSSRRLSLVPLGNLLVSLDDFSAAGSRGSASGRSLAGPCGPAWTESSWPGRSGPVVGPR